MFWPVTRFYDGYICRYMENFYSRVAASIKEKGISGLMMDAGIGPGRLPVKVSGLVPEVEIIGLDISVDMLKIACRNIIQAGVKDRVSLTRGSLYKIPFKDESFDFIVSTGVIYHLRDEVSVLNELYRVLKPHGEMWLYDGRRDASRKEIRTTIGKVRKDRFTVPVRVVECIWPYYSNLGYKTQVYTDGKVAEAMKKSLFRDYELSIEDAIVKIVIKKN